MGGVRALVLASVKSGKSVDNKKRGDLRASMIRFFYLLILLILIRIGGVRALVLASVKSG